MAEYGQQGGNYYGGERSAPSDNWGRQATGSGGARPNQHSRGRRRENREQHATQSSGSPVLTAPAERETPKEKESRTAIFVSTDAPKLNLSSVLRKLTEFGHLRVHHFRDKQNFGFVEFVDEASVERAIAGLNGQQIDGQLIRVERSSRVTPHKDPRQPESDHSSTIVVKSLPYALRHENWVQLLSEFEIKPKNVTFLYDNGGSFRGISFVDYNTVEDASMMIPLLSGFEVGGRKLHAEYKKQLPKEESDAAAKDEEQRRLFEQLRAFKDNAALQEFAFPSSFTQMQRKLIHKIAEKLGLSHWSQGEGDDRFIVVSKQRKPAPEAAAPIAGPVESNAAEAQTTTPPSPHPGVPPTPASPPGGTTAEVGGWVRKPSALQQAARQPKIPDGTRGFNEEYRAARARNRKSAAPPLSWMVEAGTSAI